jgi:hypothetical protein
MAWIFVSLPLCLSFALLFYPSALCTQITWMTLQMKPSDLPMMMPLWVACKYFQVKQILLISVSFTLTGLILTTSLRLIVRSAMQLGYFEDPFVKYFVKRPVRRMPIINRGMYATRETTPPKQVVNPCLIFSRVSYTQPCSRYFGAAVLITTRPFSNLQ